MDCRNDTLFLANPEVPDSFFIRLGESYTMQVRGILLSNCYVFAFLSATGIFLIRFFFLDQYLGTDVPFLLFFVAIIAAAYCGGMKPGLFASAVSAFYALYFFIGPQQSAVLNPKSLIELGLFGVVSFIVCHLCDQLYKANAKLTREKQRLNITLKKLSASEEQSSRILNSTQDCVKVLSPEGRFISVNEVGLSLFGIQTANEIVDNLYTDYWQGEYHHEALHSLQQAQEGKIARFQGALLLGKETKWWDVIASPILDDDGNVYQILVISRDVTELVDTQKELSIAKDQAEAANRAKSEFLSNMSHELRTPLNAIVGLANLLELSSPLADEQKEFISTLKLSSTSLLSLINDILDIAKIEAGEISFKKEGFDLAKTLESVVQVHRVQADLKNIELSYDQQGIDHSYFIGDEQRIRQILVNLISNAIKFTRLGSVKIYTTVSSQKDSVANVSISVVDTGIGIAPDKIDTVFNKFTQADMSISRDFGGTGLGLSISKTLANAMGGEIRVASELGKGSVFILDLPLEMREPPSRVFSTRKVDNREEKASHRYKVLLVEDNSANVLVASNILKKMGIEFDIANNGLDALAKFRSASYDAIIMDIQMPKMNGYDVTRIIREEEQPGNHVPIIGITAYAFSQDREMCIAVGMDDYISKPFEPQVFQEKILRLLHGKKDPHLHTNVS
jgi:PAS domain S-box-containing protein